jgi:hypothetical protein
MHRMSISLHVFFAILIIKLVSAETVNVFIIDSTNSAIF